MTATDTYGTTPWLRGASRWPLMPVKYLLAQRITDGPHETPEFVDAGYPFLSVDGIQDGELQFEGCRFVSEDQHREFRRKAAPRRGDVLFGKAASTGKIARVKTDIEFSIWSPLALLRPSEIKVTSGFLEYALKSQIAQGQIDVLVTTNTQNNISMDAIPRIRIPLPVLPQQRAIADYLDRETARLDALVVAKERVLGLLAEKRRALITRAVTRGLDPSAPLRDSGIPWLGEIPAHWGVVQLKRAALVIDCKHKTVPFVNEGIPLASIREVQSWGVDLSSAKMTTEDEYLLMIEGERDPRAGDVIVSRNATVGAAALVPHGLRFCMGQDVSLVRPQVGLEPSFLNWLFRSDAVANQVISASIGSTFSRINVEQIKELIIPLPGFGEQGAIVSHLATETSKLYAVRAATERTIELIKERRSALIAAAVTGQLEVPEVIA